MEIEKMKKDIPFTEEKTENNNHLGDKLIYHFFPPLCFCIIGGIIIFAICSIIFMKNTGNNSIVKNSLFQLNLQLNEQLLLQVESLLIYRTQSIFDLLRKIENTTKFFSKIYNEYITNSEEKDNSDFITYIKKYTVNINEITKDIEKNLLNAVIGKNEEINDNNDFINNNVKDLYSFSAIIPMLNAMYNSTNLKEEYIEDIFIIMNKNEIFFDFPLSNDTMFKMGGNRAFCFNEFRNLEEEKVAIPNRYDYHCQLWFSDSINLQRLMNTNYYISPPYYIQKTDKILITTMCINSTKLNSSSNFGDYYLLCINVKYQIILNDLELINHKLYGYFFVARVFNQRTFYYPKSKIDTKDKKTYYFDNFNVEEFQLNDNYYLDELNEYINNKNTFINRHYKDEVNSILEIDNPELKGEFLKNDKKYYYYIYPVFNHLSDETINLLNIIYIYADETTENIINKISDKLINAETFIFLFIVFLIQALVSMTFVKHLIRAIAFNIILPMKNIKKVFEKFNNEGEVIDSDAHLVLKNNNSSINIPGEMDFLDKKNKNRITQKHLSKPVIHKANKKLESKNGISQNINFIGPIDENDDFLNNYEDSGSDSDDEENYVNIRSKDIQDLFSKMINVKNSLDIVYSDDQNDVKKLPDILFASEIFKEIKNENAKNICISNIANIFLKLKKYDLAIMHLIESEQSLDNENTKENENISSNNQSQIFNFKKKIKKKMSTIFQRLAVSENNLNKEQLEQKIIEKNKILIESRYPKLIYCYKKFFKNLKKLKKLKLTKQLEKNKINEYDYFVSKNYHMLNTFKEYIEKYIELCQIEGNYLNSNNRYIQSLLNKIEFIIKYEITEENTNNIEEQFDLLNELLIKVKKLIKGNKEIIKPKNILKFLLKEEFTNELDEIPNCILMQRLNYYKGNLALKCGHYLEAIKKYQKVFSKICDEITDMQIVNKSMKKLIKIAELMKNKCNYINKNNEENILKQYIMDKKKELKKFVSLERNFIILISTNTENLDFFFNSLENSNYIIDNYIKGSDKYCIAFASSDRGLGGGIKLIVKLEEKNKQRNDALMNYIQDIKQNYNLLLNFEEKNEDDIKYILQKSKIYNDNNERKTFYIFFCNKNRLSHESIKYLSDDEISNYLEEGKEKLILIMYDNYESNDNKNNVINSLVPMEGKEININELNKNIVSFIHFDDIQKLKDDVMMYGKINNIDNYFNFEKYELKKFD